MASKGGGGGGEKHKHCFHYYAKRYFRPRHLN